MKRHFFQLFELSQEFRLNLGKRSGMVVFGTLFSEYKRLKPKIKPSNLVIV